MQQFLYFVFCYHLTSSSSFLQGIAKTSFSSALASCVISTYFSWLNSSCLTNSCTGTSSAFAIAMRASRLGWVVLVTHLDTVAGSLPSLSDSHLLFRSRSARTTLIRFNFAMIDYCCLTAKLQKIIGTNAEMLKKLHKCAKI